MAFKFGSGMSQFNCNIGLSQADSLLNIGLSLRWEHAFYHLTYYITATLIVSELLVAFVLAMPVGPVSLSWQYASRFKENTLVNMSLDAP